MRRLLVIIGLLALGVGVDGWFLIPDLVHGGQTKAGASALYPWATTGAFNTPGNLFFPLRTVPRTSASPALFVEAPDWYLAWALVAAASPWAAWGRALRLAGAALTALLVCVLLPILIPGVWGALPRQIQEVQFPYRLNTYVALGVAVRVLVAAAGIVRCRQARRLTTLWLSGALIAVTSVSVGICVWQLWVPDPNQITSYHNRQQIPQNSDEPPKTWYANGDYSDATNPVVDGLSQRLTIPPQAITADQVTLRLPAPAGHSPFFANIAAGPYAVALGGGLARVGRARNWTEVVRRIDSGQGPVTISLRAAGGAVALGRDVTALSGLVLLLLVLAATAAKLAALARRRPQPPVPDGRSVDR